MAAGKDKKKASSHQCSASPWVPGRRGTSWYPRHGGLPAVHPWSAASPGPPAFPVGAFVAKDRRCQKVMCRGQCPPLRGGCKPQRLPVPPATSHQLSGGMHPGPHPSRGAEHPWVPRCWSWVQRHRASLHRACGVPGIPQTGSPLTSAGSGSCTGAGGVSFVRWGPGGWGTTRSIQPSIPLPAGSKEGSPAGERPAAAVQAPRGAPSASAAHAVSGQPKRSSASLCFHGLPGQRSTAARPDQTQLSSPPATVIGSKLCPLF